MYLVEMSAKRVIDQIGRTAQVQTVIMQPVECGCASQRRATTNVSAKVKPRSRPSLTTGPGEKVQTPLGWYGTW